MRASPFATALVAWLVPGGGHFLVGESRKGAVFLVMLGAMFAIGLSFRGELFAFDTGDPLVFLAALAQWALGLPRIFAAMFGGGHGQITAVTYEYGNTFLIVGGLLNTLVLLDAVDRARGILRR
jgi:hypothetical protein